MTTCLWGNKPATKLFQVFMPTTSFILHYCHYEQKLGVLEHCLTLMPRERFTREWVKWKKIIGNASGLWLLWNSDKVEVTNITSTEQEIHFLVKVMPSKLS